MVFLLRCYLKSLNIYKYSKAIKLVIVKCKSDHNFHYKFVNIAFNIFLNFKMSKSLRSCPNKNVNLKKKGKVV